MSRSTVPSINIPVEIPPEIASEYTHRRRTERPSTISILMSYPMLVIGTLIFLIYFFFVYSFRSNGNGIGLL